MLISKLERCLAVLQVAEKRDHMTYNDMLVATKLEKAEFEGSLNLLVKNLIITKQANLNNHDFTYSSTERGYTILRFFGLNNVFSVSAP